MTVNSGQLTVEGDSQGTVDSGQLTVKGNSRQSRVGRAKVTVEAFKPKSAVAIDS